MHRHTLHALRAGIGAALAVATLSVAGRAQPSTRAGATPPAASGATLTVDRIFRHEEFKSATLPSVHWLKDGRSYVDVRANAGGGSDIVRVDLLTGASTVLADAASLVDAGGARFEVEEIELSPDESRALLFHGSVPVWRTNTRGVYHVIDFRTKKLTPIVTVTTPGVSHGQERDSTPPEQEQLLGKRPSFLARGLQSGAADPALQMFAKWSPDGRQVAFVRANNLWVTDLASGRERQLTFDGSDDIINGTTDWVYEEELGLKDAFRWSPDSKRIAYWRFDQSAVPAFPMVNELGTYPRVSVLRYPKAGAPNSRVRLGVLDLSPGGRPATRWLEVGGDTGSYLVRMDWLGADSLWVVRMPRRQNQADVLLLSAATGTGRTVLTDRDSAYVDVDDEGMLWIDGGRRLLWRSDRSGWRQVYLYDRGGRLVRQVTRDGADVLAIAAYDSARGDVYVQAAAPTPTQRQLFRYALDGQKPGVQVTQAPGTHKGTVGPGARFLVDQHSSLGKPTTSTLYELPSMRTLRVLEDNGALQRRLTALRARAPEFLKVPTPGGVALDAYRIVPADFDSTRKYPVLMYVYGGPASPQVNDAWGGTRYLWHLMLAQQGYVVMVVDNRGSAWRGNAFRKQTQLHLGELESQDQIDAAKWIASRGWADASRIGIWGWSYGGYMTSMASFRGGDLFRTAIAVAPVADWSLYDTIYTERFMWTPQGNPEGYKRSAPLAHVNGLSARFLLVHGTGDDNVHPQNTTQLVQALQDAGKPFYMMLYPNKTHSISGPVSQGHLYDMMTRFLNENLKGAEGQKVMQ
ncbi:MAG TPA: S9 family peptidase [Gemmatimonadaceae bacterium]|nr:S9 family peptidase [Gemmatimonadaceae bacterium]